MEKIRIAFGEDPFKAQENLKIENGEATHGMIIDCADTFVVNIPNGATALAMAPSSEDKHE